MSALNLLLEVKSKTYYYRKRHRFSVKVNRGYKFFVNIWAAIKEAK